MRIVPFVLFSVLLVSAPRAGGEATAWHDPSPHRVQFVTIEPGVSLETLDWGGRGRPVVLLAGYNTAHIYDHFATELSRYCHVYGITRRGFGASSTPADGYDAERSARDVLAVLEHLGIKRPVLIGHSFGGDDLNRIGAEYPERISGLVYLNSGEDATLGAGIWKKIGIDPAELQSVHNQLPSSVRNPEPAPQGASLQEYRAWEARVHGVAMPESELRQLYDVGSDGKVGKYKIASWVRDAISRGALKPEFQKIHVPALALFAGTPPLAREIATEHPENQQERAAVERMLWGKRAIAKEHEAELSAIPGIHEHELVGANFYIWLSNENDVVREVRAFLTRLH